jgi:molybdopterin-guanine dinucleotide biosynthesis protein A
MQGRDKSTIAVHGRPIVERQLAVLVKRFSPIAMVGDHVNTEGLEIEALPDRIGGKGPLDGIAAALAWSSKPWVFVIASDMPTPSLELIDALLSARSKESDIVGVVANGRAQPLFALYRQALLPLIEGRLRDGHYRASDLFDASSGVSLTSLSEEKLRQVDPELHSFQNLNTPEDVLTSGGRIE